MISCKMGVRFIAARFVGLFSLDYSEPIIFIIVIRCHAIYLYALTIQIATCLNCFEHLLKMLTFKYIFFMENDDSDLIIQILDMLKRLYHERVKLIGKEGGEDVNDAERLRKQLYSMRKLIEVIAEQPNGKQTTAVYTIEG